MTLTDEQIKDMLEMFGDALPDPEIFPRTFVYYVKLYLHVTKLNG